ncbi:HpcH/HpaI aldolase/citrate lyase family protein [Thermomonospora catenispora]|uniref:HpcH/HpaI aldolase/citrate lyase family protein n=1 Tax=Thermomonospora catenispora TaxID=2493090 RepID=UPI00111D5F09|nr:HpcH/HpaI aldolase/citrate lyase family protein [Thermomonospora catenispora]TNY35762.1 ATP/GTP-binding protein [Thermomonospora catenispora]
MRHFDHVSAARRKRLFYRHPRPFGRDSDPRVLAVALGATLYSPATRPALLDDIVKAARRGVMSMVVCLEDAIPDDEVPAAEANLVAQVRRAHRTGARVPLLFIRVRTPEQIGDLTRRLGDAVELISGFVLPKFTAAAGEAFLDALREASAQAPRPLLAMPVIESREAVYRETRTEMLHDVARLLAKHADLVLAVRLGGTDMCAAYGLRRPPDLTIYDIHPVASVIADVVNVLGRADGSGFVITGPVWEYFSAGERLFKPQLRQAPFERRHAIGLRRHIISAELDGLIREVHLDKANGLIGKTVIHPSHVPAVHALSVVTHEEYCDAADILGETGGGAMASSYANKMNEAKPHRAWAERLMLRAQVFGVAAEDVTFVELLKAAGGT